MALETGRVHWRLLQTRDEAAGLESMPEPGRAEPEEARSDIEATMGSADVHGREILSISSQEGGERAEDAAAGAVAEDVCEDIRQSHALNVVVRIRSIAVGTAATAAPPASHATTDDIAVAASAARASGAMDGSVGRAAQAANEPVETSMTHQVACEVGTIGGGTIGGGTTGGARYGTNACTDVAAAGAGRSSGNGVRSGLHIVISMSPWKTQLKRLCKRLGGAVVSPEVNRWDGRDRLMEGRCCTLSCFTW